MYANYDYYSTEYGGKMSADDYKRFGRKAERRIDSTTGNKLQFAYPTNERSIEAVKDCVCELANFIWQIDSYNYAVMESVGTVKEADGTVKGKVITSISSGSESIGYSASGSASAAAMEAAKDKKIADAMIYGMIYDCLNGVLDSNDIPLLYAGLPYPVKNAPISRPPENKPEEPTEPPEIPPQESEDSESVQAQSNTENKFGTVGVGYEDSIVVYNRYVRGTFQTEEYYGTRFDNVRIEFTEEENQTKAGQENTSVCILKIHNDNTLPKPFKDPVSWKKLTTEEMQENFTLQKGEDFFVIVKRKGLNLDVEAPVGLQSSDDPPYGGNFFEYMKGKYGYVYSINSFEQKDLIPYFQVGGL